MTTAPAAPATPATAPPVVASRVRTATVLRWELRKLAAQARGRWTLLGCLLGPPLVVLVLHAQARPPKDTLYGRHVPESGYAVPLLLLGFAAQWVLPLLTALVAGDLFAAEDHHGTWKTVLTRSVSRGQLFWAKTAAAALFSTAVLAVLAASTIASSLLVVGRQPLIGLTGQLVPSGTALPLVVAAWATALPPVLALTAVGLLLSVVSRNPSVGVVGPVVVALVLQLLASLGGLDVVRPLLLTTGFESWHGLLTEHRYLGPGGRERRGVRGLGRRSLAVAATRAPPPRRHRRLTVPHRPPARRTPAALLAALAVLGLTGCGRSDVTRSRLEASLAPTFAHLYVHQQVDLLGHPGVTTASVAARATCDKGGPKVADRGAGADWVCLVDYRDETQAAQEGKFELQARSSSCWTASGPSKLIGPVMISDRRGRDVPNPVFEFDGCFDPRG